MDSDSLSLESSDNIKCSICENYLSYFPIYLTNDGKNICGRCPATSEKSQNLAFEALSKSVSFPCRYKKEGCNEKMVPEVISKHEPICPYKVLKCPSAYFAGCNWKGARPTIMGHCLDNHSELFLQDNKFVVDFSQSAQSDNFLKHDNTLYIFSRNFDATSNVLRYSIHHVEDELELKNYSGQLSLQNGKTVLLNKYFTTSYEEKEYESVVLDSLKVKHETALITGRIIFGEHIEDTVSVQERINYELLSQLKCSLCYVYVLPPIYLYNDNSIYCTKCNSDYTSRNYNLDNMANKLIYPCENKERGCNMVLKPEEMRKHQNLCDYKLHNCPLANHNECSWKGVGTDLFDHIEKNHTETLIENHASATLDLGSSGLFMMRYLNHLFKIEWYAYDYYRMNRKTTNKKYSVSCYWRVQQVDYFENTFRYEIEVIDTTNSYRSTVGKQKCVLVSDDDTDFYDLDEECCVLIFSSKYLENLLDSNECLTFKVSLFSDII